MKKRNQAACVVTSLLASTGAGAVTVAANLADLSLEQLSSIEVTSVSKRAQRLADVPGSVYVISNDDIRRSGATSLGEALRLAPNLHVARADANQWAVSARGFNSVLANKMLVLVDGRTVYSPLFSGVFWEAQGVMLEDIERIEVLSGSGGTLYGSNAFNGVVNIITRSAAETHGTLIATGAGNNDARLSARHGASTASGIDYRLYAQRSLRDNTRLTSGAPVRDGAGKNQAGFRTDRSEAGQQLTLQGDVYENDVDQAPQARKVSGANLLGRWSRTGDNGSRSQVQAYFDRAERDQPGAIRDTLDTWDVEIQHLSKPRAGHELLTGGGLRVLNDRVTNTNPASASLLPAKRRMKLWNVFAQDEIPLGDDLMLTLGLKLEHNDYTGAEWLPNARLAWEAGSNKLLWGAVSRAVRTPSRVDTDFFNAAVAGGPNFRSEVARVYELGWRAQPLPSLSYSATLFHHDVGRLRSLDAGPGGATFNNNFEGRVSGLETWGQWRASERWRLSAGYVHQRQRFNPLPGTTPLGGAASLGNDPRNRWTLGSALDLGGNMEFDVQVRRVGSLPNPVVPAYTAVDARWGWRVRPDLELSITVRNLGDLGHPEWGNPANRVEFDRSVFFKAVWRI